MLRDVAGKRLDVDLARNERKHATRLHPRRLSDEMDDDGRVDGPVEPHLAQIDVRDRPANRILLVVGEHRGMDALLPFEHDVQDRVEAGRAADSGPKLALGDGDRAGVAVPVENSRHDAVRAQAPRMARAALVALTNLELEPVSGHGGRL